MKFTISIKLGRTPTLYQVEKMSDDGMHERYRIYKGNEFVILESNRPFLRNKGLKKKRPIWKRVDGNMNFATSLEQVITAIMSVIDKPANTK